MSPDQFKKIDTETQATVRDMTAEEIQAEIKNTRELIEYHQACVASMSRTLIDRREDARHEERVKLSANDRSYISPPAGLQDAIKRSLACRVDAFDADNLPEA